MATPGTPKFDKTRKEHVSGEGKELWTKRQNDQPKLFANIKIKQKLVKKQENEKKMKAMSYENVKNLQTLKPRPENSLKSENPFEVTGNKTVKKAKDNWGSAGKDSHPLTSGQAKTQYSQEKLKAMVANINKHEQKAMKMLNKMQLPKTILPVNSNGSQADFGLVEYVLDKDKKKEIPKVCNCINRVDKIARLITSNQEPNFPVIVSSTKLHIVNILNEMYSILMILLLIGLILCCLILGQ